MRRPVYPASQRTYGLVAGSHQSSWTNRPLCRPKASIWVVASITLIARSRCWSVAAGAADRQAQNSPMTPRISSHRDPPTALVASVIVGSACVPDHHLGPAPTLVLPLQSACPEALVLLVKPLADGIHDPEDYRRRRRRQKNINRGQQTGGRHLDPRKVLLRDIARLVLLHSVGVQHHHATSGVPLGVPERDNQVVRPEALLGDRCTGDRDQDCPVAAGAVVQERNVGAVPEHDLLS